MLNLAHFFRSEYSPASSSKTNRATSALPCPDLISDPYQILKQLKELAHQADLGRLLFLIEGDTRGSPLKSFDLDIEKQTIEIETFELQSNMIDKYLTFIGNCHEYRIAFSGKVLTQLSPHRLSLTWPSEIIHTSGREYYRIHPKNKFPVLVKTPTKQLNGHLYDLSEGGIGITISASDHAYFQELSNHEVIILLAGHHLITQVSICNQTSRDANLAMRIGFAFTHIAPQEQAKLRKILLQLQSRH